MNPEEEFSNYKWAIARISYQLSRCQIPIFCRGASERYRNHSPVIAIGLFWLVNTKYSFICAIYSLEKSTFFSLRSLMVKKQKRILGETAGTLYKAFRVVFLQKP
ncbi:MAG: hypothetical protein CSA33_05015 [Desulfobulbus propionicus]|nr:MAG: hypothetical protein CSA33_05015 [Desulfobulbus propionicus]